MITATIRSGQVGDLPAVHRLVRELAIYEKAEAEFVASIADYRRNFDDGVFDLLIAEVDDDVVGMALFYLAYSTWKGRMMYLEDFVISAPWRRRGVGRQLFEGFLQEARRRKCRLVKWQVLDWNEPALAFYQKHGATIETEWWNGKIIFETEV